jgi:hypothetical protein
VAPSFSPKANLAELSTENLAEQTASEPVTIDIFMIAHLNFAGDPVPRHTMTIDSCTEGVALALKTPFANLPEHEQFRIRELCGIPTPVSVIVADIRAGRNVSKLLIKIAEAGLSLSDKVIKEACAKVRNGTSVSMIFSELKSSADRTSQAKKAAAGQASRPGTSK